MEYSFRPDMPQEYIHKETQYVSLLHQAVLKLNEENGWDVDPTDCLDGVFIQIRNHGGNPYQLLGLMTEKEPPRIKFTDDDYISAAISVSDEMVDFLLSEDYAEKKRDQFEDSESVCFSDDEDMDDDESIQSQEDDPFYESEWEYN